MLPCRENDCILDNSQIAGSLYEDIVQLELRSTPQRRLGPATPSEVSWAARLLSAEDSAAATESSLFKFLGLSQQAFNQGNSRLAAKMLKKAKQSTVLPQLSAAQLVVACQEACQEGLQSEAGNDAVGKLHSLVKNSLPAGKLESPDGKVGALACLQLVDLAQGKHDDTCHLGGPEGAEVGEYTQLWHACEGKDQTQLQLLVAATQLEPDMALPWATLSNWLHCKLSDDFWKVSLLDKVLVNNLGPSNANLSYGCQIMQPS